MNRWCGSTGLISVISVIFVVLVGIAPTGCVHQSPLINAAGGGDSIGLNALLDKGANVNEHWMGWTPLMIAASNGKTETAKILLDRGADINARSSASYYNGWTPLMIAANSGHGGVVKLLLERGADVELKSKDNLVEEYNKNALQMAEERGHTVVAKMIAAAMEDRYGNVTQASSSTRGISAVKSDIDDVPSARVKINKNAYAIVIGIESYRQKLPKADFAASDAKIVTAYLEKVLGYPEKNVITLINDQAAKSDFEKYFERWLVNNVEQDSTVFVYYSGHGAPNLKTGDAYLVPYDGDPAFIDETGYSLKRLYAALGKLSAKGITVALDSCFSGAGGRSVLAKGSRPLVMNLQGNVVLPKNMTVLSASSGEQISSTYDEKGHGLFTYFLLKGIKNEGVVKSDGTLKIDDLYGYVKPQVERIARKQYNNEQTPQLIEPKGN